MLVIENGLVLSADEVVLQAYLNDQAMQHMKRCYATTPDAYMTERVQALRRVADRFLASSASGHEFRTSQVPTEDSAPNVDQLPQEMTARQVAPVLDVSDHTCDGYAARSESCGRSQSSRSPATR